MHTSKKILFIFFALLFSFMNEAFAQRRRGFDITQGMTVTPHGGYNLFFGDLVDKSRGSISAGVLVDRELTEIFSARVQLIGGQMQGKQVPEYTNKSYAEFENRYVEFTIGGSYRPLNHAFGYFKQRTFQPYAHLNGGLVYYNSTEYWGPLGPGPDGEEWRSAAEIAPVITMGGGAKIWINPVMSANIELTGSLPFSDKMDAHDVWYSAEDWEAEVNPNSTDPYDFYYTLSVGLSFTIQDSKLNNDPKYNRKSYIKTRSFYQSKSRRSPSKRGRYNKRFLFF